MWCELCNLIPLEVTTGDIQEYEKRLEEKKKLEKQSLVERFAFWLLTL